MITKNQYLANPCKAASIPYWKVKTIIPPEEIVIIHHDDFCASKYSQYIDAPYFRLYHNLQNLSSPQIPEGCLLCEISLEEYARHINSCYGNSCVSASELYGYTMRSVYNASLWIAVKDKGSDAVIATGIAELDCEIGEGVLEWIQVSQEYRRRGLGRYLVSELLWRMKGSANFATVSGQCNNPTNPEQLYRTCGFTGDDIWHILRK